MWPIFMTSQEETSFAAAERDKPTVASSSGTTLFFFLSSGGRVGDISLSSYLVVQAGSYLLPPVRGTQCALLCRRGWLFRN